MKVAENIDLKKSLFELNISEIKEYRLLPVKMVAIETEKALEIEPIRGRKQFFAKSILRISKTGEIWVKEWKYRSMYGE